MMTSTTQRNKEREKSARHTETVLTTTKYQAARQMEKYEC